MAVRLPKSIFYHIGRTGGFWVRDVLIQNNLFLSEIGQIHDFPLPSDPNVFKFCFIRNPIYWLRSFWIHEVTSGWNNSHYSNMVKDDDFIKFLENCLISFPEGPASEVFDPYINICNYVGKTENLISDLEIALNLSSEKYNLNTIISSTPKNKSKIKAITEKALIPKSILNDLLKTENKLIKNFGYSDFDYGHIIQEQKRSSNSYLVPVFNKQITAEEVKSIADKPFVYPIPLFKNYVISNSINNSRNDFYKFLNTIQEYTNITESTKILTLTRDTLFAHQLNNEFNCTVISLIEDKFLESADRLNLVTKPKKNSVQHLSYQKEENLFRLIEDLKDNNEFNIIICNLDELINGDIEIMLNYFNHILSKAGSIFISCTLLDINKNISTTILLNKNQNPFGNSPIKFNNYRMIENHVKNVDKNLHKIELHDKYSFGISISKKESISSWLSSYESEYPICDIKRRSIFCKFHIEIKYN